MTTSTFNDTYAGEVAMVLKSSRAKINGVSMKVYSWQTVDVSKCVTTGFRGAFASIDRAIEAASKHAKFSNIVTG